MNTPRRRRRLSRRAATFLTLAAVGACSAAAPSVASAASVSVQAPASAPAGTDVPVRVDGSVTEQEGDSTLSVLWARERTRCGFDSFAEFLDDGEYLLEEIPLGDGPFSFQQSLRFARTGGYQLCAYIEDDFSFGALASARATVNVTSPPPPSACPPGTPGALRFAGLPKRIVVGRRESFGLKSIGPGSRVEGPVEIRMVARNGRGKTFFEGKTQRRGARLFSISLEYRERPVRVYASYVQRLTDGTLCRQAMSRRVRGQNRVYVNFAGFRQYKPRTFYMGASTRITKLRWRGWNKPRARGRGVLPFNDCVPYCAVGTITPYRVRVTLSRVRRCGNHYRYRKMTYRYSGRKPPQVSRSATTRVRCFW